MQDKFTEYINLTKQMGELRKKIKELKDESITLEDQIKEYMLENNMDSISFNEGEILLYKRKISQTFKKESIVEKLTQELNDVNKAQRLTESIMSNKKFIEQDKIKANVKK